MSFTTTGVERFWLCLLPRGASLWVWWYGLGMSLWDRLDIKDLYCQGSSLSRGQILALWFLGHQRKHLHENMRFHSWCYVNWSITSLYKSIVWLRDCRALRLSPGAVQAQSLLWRMSQSKWTVWAKGEKGSRDTKRCITQPRWCDRWRELGGEPKFLQFQFTLLPEQTTVVIALLFCILTLPTKLTFLASRTDTVPVQSSGVF